MFKYQRPLRKRNIEPDRLLVLRGNLDTSRLTAFKRRNLDTSRLTAFRRRNLNRKKFDPTWLTALRRRNLDTSRLTAFRRNPICLRRGIRKRRRQGRRRGGLNRDLQFRRNLDPGRLMAFNPRKTCQCDCHRFWRRNPAPNGKPWGPNLYNPLIDKSHKFKDESHYKAMLQRRNPWRRHAAF